MSEWQHARLSLRLKVSQTVTAGGSLRRRRHSADPVRAVATACGLLLYPHRVASELDHLTGLAGWNLVQRPARL